MKIKKLKVINKFKAANRYLLAKSPKVSPIGPTKKVNIQKPEPYSNTIFGTNQTNYRQPIIRFLTHDKSALSKFQELKVSSPYHLPCKRTHRSVDKNLLNLAYMLFLFFGYVTFLFFHPQCSMEISRH